ncbi:MAG: hypothetical protein ACOY82_16905 [Pseudomonadota bacterium]|jgi:hypothetical protein
MENTDASRYHRLHGLRKPRLVYRPKDFIDYALMCLASGAIAWFCFGPATPLAWVSAFLSLALVVTFVLRHGVEFAVPLILRRPQDLVLMVYYKIVNLRWPYFFALGLLLLENLFVRLTPDLPHKVELMRGIAVWLFWIHLGATTAMRTAILFAHLAKREHALDFLLQTSWKRLMPEKPNIVLEIFHAYFTGLLAHLLLVAPWYLIIHLVDYSLLLLPVCVVLNIWTQWQYMKVINDWFYRDHWLGHNSEIEFLYLHGPHHDAIPSGLIGVAGNGVLEGFFRHTLGAPGPFYQPLAAFLFYCFEVKADMDEHQYIPGIYPKKNRGLIRASQHSTHHFGRIEPYGFGVYLDQPDLPEPARRRLSKFPPVFQNAIRLDMRLNGFEWDNPVYRRYLELFDRYQPESSAETPSGADGTPPETRPS